MLKPPFGFGSAYWTISVYANDAESADAGKFYQDMVQREADVLRSGIVYGASTFKGMMLFLRRMFPIMLLGHFLGTAVCTVFAVLGIIRLDGWIFTLALLLSVLLIMCTFFLTYPSRGLRKH